MPVRIQYEIDSPDFQRISKAGLSRVAQAAFKKAIEWFKEKRLEYRFRGNIQALLRWKRRASGWDKVKGQIRPGTRGQAHVFTGRAKRQFDAATIKTTGGKTIRAHLVVSGLHEGYSRTRKGRSMRDEITRTANFEDKEMSKIVEAEMIKGLNKELTTKRKRRRVR